MVIPFLEEGEYNDQITSQQFSRYLHKSDYFNIVTPYLLEKKYNRLVAMVIEYLRRANKFRKTERINLPKSNPKSSSLGSIALAGLTGYLLGKK